MYEQRPSTRDRIATFSAVLLIHVTLAAVLINISPEAREQLPQEVIEIFDVTERPPPPEEEVVQLQPEPEQDAPREEEGAASAENIRSQATPVAAPRPPIQLPIPPPMPVSPTPRQGSDPTQGASDRPGPGTGAGGVGTGTGSGGSGSGTGGGGSGGQGTRPALITPSLSRRDYPDEVSRFWPRSRDAFVAVAVRVQLDGRGTDCKINKSSGVPAIDQWTCRLVETRLRFRPATDDRGRPVVAWYGYVQR
jgi:protein TonB